MFNTHEIQHLSNRLVNNIIYGFGMMIKRWDRRDNMGFHISGLGQLAQMPFMQRSFPEQQGATLCFSLSWTSAARISRFSL